MTPPRKPILQGRRQSDACVEIRSMLKTGKKAFISLANILGALSMCDRRAWPRDHQQDMAVVATSASLLSSAISGQPIGSLAAELSSKARQYGLHADPQRTMNAHIEHHRMNGRSSTIAALSLLRIACRRKHGKYDNSALHRLGAGVCLVPMLDSCTGFTCLPLV